VTTLEYNNLKIDHRQIQIYTPYNYADLYLQSRSTQFDFAATFSSLEHSGLGRYSDPLNPYGDLEAMAQVCTILDRLRIVPPQTKYSITSLNINRLLL
jgi:hypothetical protein